MSKILLYSNGYTWWTVSPNLQRHLHDSHHFIQIWYLELCSLEFKANVPWNFEYEPKEWCIYFSSPNSVKWSTQAIVWHCSKGIANKVFISTLAYRPSSSNWTLTIHIQYCLTMLTYSWSLFTLNLIGVPFCNFFIPLWTFLIWIYLLWYYCKFQIGFPWWFHILIQRFLQPLFLWPNLASIFSVCFCFCFSFSKAVSLKQDMQNWNWHCIPWETIVC